MDVKEIDVNRKPTKEELKMLEATEAMPIVYDEDSPELSDEELSQFKRISGGRKKNEESRRSSLMEYEGYHAKIEFDQEDQIFVGHVLGINDSINFHGRSVDELKAEFHNAVANYLDYCRQAGKEPEREYKGTFNVRIKPEQHRKIALYAANEGITINQFVARAIEDELAAVEEN